MIDLFAIFDLFSATFIFLLGYYVFLKDSKRDVNRLFFLLTLATTFWAFSSFGLRINKISPPIEKGIPLEKSKIFNIFNEMGWAGITFIPSIFLHLNLVITKKKEFLEKRFFLSLIYFLSFFFFLITLHGTLIGVEENFYFYIFFTLFFSLCLFLSFIFLFLQYFSLRSFQEKIKIGFFLLGTLIPGLFGTVLDVFIPLVKHGGYRGTTYSLYSYTVGLSFVAIGILRYGLFVDYRTILETIFKQLSELVIVTDKEGLILLTNETTLSKFGYKEEEFIGREIEEFLKDGKEKKKEIFDRLKKSTTILEEKISFLTKRKEEIPFLSVVSQIKEGVIFVGKDIKEMVEYQKKLEEEIKERTKELEEAKSVLEIKVQARTKELRELAESLEEQVRQRTKELQEKVEQLEKFQKIAVGRELKMVELKKEIEKLKKLKNGNKF